MKNQLLLVLVVLALGFASCGQKNVNQPKDNLSENPEVSASSFWKTMDFCYVENGKLFFYSLKDGNAAPYVNETDDILAAIYSKKNGMLYYNVVKDGGLVLKCLDLNETDPMPEQVANWDIPVKDESEYEMNPFGRMYFNVDETQIALERDLAWFAGMYYNLAVYDCAAKTVTVHKLYREVDFEEYGYPYEDLPDESGFNRWGTGTSADSKGDLLENVGNEIYYVGDGQRVCLTDRIDMDEVFGFGLSKEEYEVDASMDPTGKRALIGYNVGMGDGTLGSYFVSSIDGRQQMMLPGSDYETSNPTWLFDGTLLYIGYDEGPALCLLDPDGNRRKVAQSEIFAVLH